MGERGVSSSDIRLLRDIVALTGTGTPARPHTRAVALTFELLDLLEQLLDSDWASFHLLEAAPGSGFRRVYQQATDHGEHLVCLAPEIAEFDATVRTDVLQEHWWGLPHSHVDRTGAPCVTSIRSFFGSREWADHPANAEYLRCVDQILLGYPAQGGDSLRVVTCRAAGRPYGLRELTLMELLLPHLRPLLGAAVREQAQHGEPPSPSRHAPVTVRQREILRLIALGLPNRAVGHHLGISEGTVRKHLEHAYERLGARSRTEAILLLHAEEAETAD